MKSQWVRFTRHVGSFIAELTQQFERYDLRTDTGRFLILTFPDDVPHMRLIGCCSRTVPNVLSPKLAFTRQIIPNSIVAHALSEGCSKFNVSKWDWMWIRSPWLDSRRINDRCPECGTPIPASHNQAMKLTGQPSGLPTSPE